MEIITTDKNKQIVTQELNLQTIYSRTNFEKNGQQTKKADFSQEKAKAAQIIYQAYKTAVNTKFCTLNDELTVKTEIANFIEWFCNSQKRPWCRIAGYVGNGKSTMLTAVKRWYDTTHARKQWTFLTAQQLVKLAIDNPSYFQTVINHHYLMIDDLGTEPNEVVVYGNKMQPVREMFYYRYETRKVTLYTTNLREVDFTAQYGERIADRCRELEQKLVFTQKSYRNENN